MDDNQPVAVDGVGREYIADMQERFTRLMTVWHDTPIKAEMASYLKIDKSKFIPKAATYINNIDLPETRGRLSNSLSTIGIAVASGYSLGVLRGVFAGLSNEQGLPGRAWTTRMINSIVKHGTGYAKISGTAVFGICSLSLVVDSLLVRFY